MPKKKQDVLAIQYEMQLRKSYSTNSFDIENKIFLGLVELFKPISIALTTIPKEAVWDKDRLTVVILSRQVVDILSLLETLKNHTNTTMVTDSFGYSPYPTTFTESQVEQMERAFSAKIVGNEIL